MALAVMQIGGKGKAENGEHSSPQGRRRRGQNPICGPSGNRPCMTDVAFVLAQHRGSFLDLTEFQCRYMLNYEVISQFKEMLRSTTNLQSSEESLCIPGKVKPYANVGSTLKKTLGDGGLLRRTKIERGKEESFPAR